MAKERQRLLFNSQILQPDTATLYWIAGVGENCKIHLGTGFSLYFCENFCFFGEIICYKWTSNSCQKVSSLYIDQGKFQIHYFTVGTPNKATKSFREIGSNKAKFWIRQPIALFANFPTQGEIRQFPARTNCSDIVICRFLPRIAYYWVCFTDSEHL